MKRLALLGSTGTIGRSTLDIVRSYPDRFAVSTLAAGSNVELLRRQALEFRPRLVALADEAAAQALAADLNPLGIEVLGGAAGVRAAATYQEAELLVSAIVGAAGLMPTVDAISAGKDVALANKETLVMAGSLVMRMVKEKGIRLLPVDSEHSAIFQALAGQQHKDIKRLILTASGGPFLYTELAEMPEVTPAQALNHPRWRMGPKISVDSATMMNKGLEIIEAHWFFDLEPEKIDVVVHPQSIIHSMVEFCDGSILAQMAVADMKGCIAYALSYPDRLPGVLPSVALTELQPLTFFNPDQEKFPSLRLAREALGLGGTAPAVLNAANEEAIKSFLLAEIGFTEIFHCVESILHEHSVQRDPTIEDIIAADAWARKKALEFIHQMP